MVKVGRLPQHHGTASSELLLLPQAESWIEELCQSSVWTHWTVGEKMGKIVHSSEVYSRTSAVRLNRSGTKFQGGRQDTATKVDVEECVT